MHITSSVISLCWILFLVYWFISSFHVKKTVQVRLGIEHLGAILIAGFLSYLALRYVGVFQPALTQCRFTWFGCRFDLFRETAYRAALVQLLSCVFATTGLIIAIIARRTLGANWSGAVVLKKDHELITHGIYAYMRHPIYTGVILMLIGTVLYINVPTLYLLTVVLFGFLWYKASIEENLMRETFPKEYGAYRKRTKALIPYVL